VWPIMVDAVLLTSCGRGLDTRDGTGFNSLGSKVREAGPRNSRAPPRRRVLTERASVRVAGTKEGLKMEAAGSTGLTGCVRLGSS
jgi:hypothetical protein